MGKIYSPPGDIKKPVLDFSNMGTYEDDVENYIEEIRKAILLQSQDEYAGKIAQFPVADNYARYMVLTMNPLVLIHIDVWDAYNYQYITRLTAKDIKENIDGQETIAKLFSKK